MNPIIFMEEDIEVQMSSIPLKLVFDFQLLLDPGFYGINICIAQHVSLTKF
jgi:hypothetical protein